MTPLTLESTAPLSGVDRPADGGRRWTLLIRDHGRWEYLHRCVDAIDHVLGLDFFDRRVLSEDGVVDPWLDGFECHTTGAARHGLAANVAQAWGALTADDEWVFDVESDMIVLDAPLEQMAEVLDANRDVAQMALLRQPWSVEEREAGGVLFGPHIASDVVCREGWLYQERIFTLNPYVAHASLLRSLSPGVETSLTEQCRARGLGFGFWGGLHDEPRVLHIGAHGGMHSPGWKP